MVGLPQLYTQLHAAQKALNEHTAQYRQPTMVQRAKRFITGNATAWDRRHTELIQQVERLSNLIRDQELQQIQKAQAAQDRLRQQRDAQIQQRKELQRIQAENEQKKREKEARDYEIRMYRQLPQQQGVIYSDDLPQVAYQRHLTSEALKIYNAQHKFKQTKNDLDKQSKGKYASKLDQRLVRQKLIADVQDAVETLRAIKRKQLTPTTNSNIQPALFIDKVRTGVTEDQDTYQTYVSVNNLIPILTADYSQMHVIIYISIVKGTSDGVEIDGDYYMYRDEGKEHYYGTGVTFEVEVHRPAGMSPYFEDDQEFQLYVQHVIFDGQIPVKLRLGMEVYYDYVDSVSVYNKNSIIDQQNIYPAGTQIVRPIIDAKNMNHNLVLRQPRLCSSNPYFKGFNLPVTAVYNNQEPVQYYGMKNIMPPNLNILCSKQLFMLYANELGAAFDYNKVYTGQEVCDIIELYHLPIHILGITDAPFQPKIHDRQIQVRSGHIYIGISAKPTMMLVKEMMADITKRFKAQQYEINTIEELLAIKLKYINDRQMPYIKHDIRNNISFISTESHMHMSQFQHDIFEITNQTYGAIYFKYNRLPLFKDFITGKGISGTPLAPLGYEFTPIIYDDSRRCHTKIDMIKSYTQSMCSLQQVYSISDVKIVRIMLSLKDYKQCMDRSSYYLCQLTAIDVIPRLLERIITFSSVMSYQSIQMLDLMCRNYDIVITIYAIYSITQCKGIMPTLQQVADHPQRIHDILTPIELKQSINQTYGLMYMQAESTMDVQTLDVLMCQDDEYVSYTKTDSLSLFNPQFPTNKMFLHCQMINNQFNLLFRDYAGCLDDICGVRTDSIMFVRAPDVIDKSMFRIEDAQSAFRQSECNNETILPQYRVYNNVYNKLFIQANPGSGKTTLISSLVGNNKSIDAYNIDINIPTDPSIKQNSCVIVCSYVLKADYTARGITNVYVYQYVNFINDMTLFDAYDTVYVDEWVMQQHTFIAKLFLSKHNVVFIGDINQNCNLESTKDKYEFYSNYEVLEKKSNFRNSLNCDKLQSLHSIIDEITRRNMWFDPKLPIPQDTMIITKSNDEAFEINKRYTGRNIIGDHVKFEHMCSTNATVQINGIKSHNDNIYYDVDNRKMAYYLGNAMTAYSCQGKQWNKVQIVRDGLSQDELYVALTRIDERKNPVTLAMQDDRIVLGAHDVCDEPLQDFSKQKEDKCVNEAFQCVIMDINKLCVADRKIYERVLTKVNNKVLLMDTADRKYKLGMIIIHFNRLCGKRVASDISGIQELVTEYDQLLEVCDV